MSAKPFFVTGLPRSRLAWLSVLLTTDTTLCVHEPSKMMSDVSELGAVWDTDRYAYVGVADSGLGFFAKEILDTWFPRTLVVWRDQRDVEQSMLAIGFARSNVCDVLSQRLLAVRHHPLVMCVGYGMLDDDRTVAQCFAHLMPGVAFDPVRHSLLSMTRIEAHVGKTINLISGRRNELNHLMRDVSPLIVPKEEHHAGTLH